MITKVCPKTRLPCDMLAVCMMMWCAKRGPGAKPMSERFLRTEERYAIHMAEQRKEPPEC